MHSDFSDITKILKYLTIIQHSFSCFFLFCDYLSTAAKCVWRQDVCYRDDDIRRDPDPRMK